MRKMKCVIASLLFVLGTLTGCSTGGSTTPAPEGQGEKAAINVLLMKQAGYSEEDATAVTNEFKEKNKDIDVNLTFVAYEALEQKILTSSMDGQFDVVLIDAPWTAKFANGGIIKDVTDKLPKEVLSDFFQGSVDAVEYQGKMYGIPWTTGTKHFFYNKEMLKQAGFEEAPKTWDELLNQAKVLKEKGIVEHPIVWSWAQAEALVCDVTTIFESFGGQMVDKDGNPTFTDPKNVQALTFMADSLKNGLSNPNSTSYLEDDVVGVVSSGKAAFALNWMYMLGKVNDPNESQVPGQIALGLIPGANGTASATVNGGMGLAVTSGSKHPEEAWKYIEFLSSKETQLKYVKNNIPDWKSLYDAPETIEVYKESLPVIKEQFNYIVNRPKVPYYGELSTEIQTQTQMVLLGEKTAEEALQAMQKKAEELTKQ
jgi:multiple sugar transport system substrate-binding protein